MEQERITIAIVDDHTLFRRGVSALLAEYEVLDILYEASDGMQMQLLFKSKGIPNVVLMDINMPNLDGYAATAWLKNQHPEVKVLALSMFDDDEAVIRMIRAGASGYILKQSSPKELLDAIKIIAAKGFYINDLVSGKLVRSVTASDDLPKLSSKETEFLVLCCSELTYKEIAEKMFVSPRTVDNYRDALFQKLTIKSRTGLVLYALQNRIFTF